MNFYYHYICIQILTQYSRYTQICIGISHRVIILWYTYHLDIAYKAYYATINYRYEKGTYILPRAARA